MTNAEAESNGRTAGAPRSDGPRPDSFQAPAETSSAGFAPAAATPPASAPASAPAPAPVAAVPETPRPAPQEKYVVWSASAEAPRSGPDDR